MKKRMYVGLFMLLFYLIFAVTALPITGTAAAIIRTNSIISSSFPIPIWWNLSIPTAFFSFIVTGSGFPPEVAYVFEKSRGMKRAGRFHIPTESELLTTKVASSSLPCRQRNRKF